MTSPEPLRITSRSQWRAWLKRNHDKKPEVWLLYYKKHTGKLTIPYDAAVEEAICFGWIDGKVRRIDDEKHMQRFTPRLRKSLWADSNLKRARRMIKAGKMTPTGLEKFKNRKGIAPKISARKKIPADLKAALEKNKKALENFLNFAPSYKTMYLWWVDSAKKPETRQKRIREIVKRSAKNQKPS